MFVKICGITNIKDAYACVEYQADAIGLNFYTRSKRYIQFDDAAAIVREVSPYVNTVGILVEPTLEDIALAFEATEVDAVQVYDPNFDLGDFKFKKSLYCAVRVKESADVTAASRLGADLVFLDTYVPGEYGGTGVRSNWDKIAESGVDLSMKFVISGGLSDSNVCQAILKLRPYGVDTASGVEISPRQKDHAKIKKFVSDAKECG
ncbi:MAG TPA: phosphoribosylanthranilate isomerase [Candidatus Kryptonia bacterium]